MTVSGGQLLAQALAASGTTEVFTLHGGHLDALLVACRDHGIRLTDTRHEATAGHAADAYARLTGRVGVCVTTSGPGYTNTYTAIVNAYLDASPVVFIVGSPPLREQETNPLQGGFDQVAGAAPVTKWAHRVTNVERIPELVALAMRHALSGRPGPVLLEVPIDVMFRPADDTTVRMPAFPVDIPRPAPTAEQVAATLDVLARAQRPVIVVGGGAVLSRCAAELRAFAEATSIPVYAPNKGEGLLPASHPLWGGTTAELAALSLVAGSPPDAALLVGTRLGLMLGGRQGPLSGATLVQIDIEYAEIGRLHDVAVPIVADCRMTLAALADAASTRDLPDFGVWAKSAATARGLHEQMFPDPTTASGRIHPYFAAREIMTNLPARTVSVLDGGEAAAWAGFFTAAEEPGEVLKLGYLGCLGAGQGFAIAAARVDPDRPVLLLTGDGAVGFHVAEFDTMVRHGMPVVTVVFNNAVWGMSIHGQRAVFGDDGIAASELADSAYEQVAVAFGGTGERVDRLEDLGPAVRRAFEAVGAGRPVCLNVAIDAEVVHPVTTSMLGDVASTSEIVIPYYENIPLG